KWLIPRKAVAPFTVDSLPAAIKVKGNIEFEAVRKITRFGEPPLLPSSFLLCPISQVPSR
ncbi:MAG TPA: hypothetical protein PL082_08790, partial [Tepidiformaceae bacterium]|nr:hypothetical protein [Tepidiformaceae bacterium]